MQKLMIIAMGVMMVFGLSNNLAAQNTVATTGVHRAITMEPHWLNTSRALAPEDLTGRVILLDFWTFCCINCIHVIPDLHYLEEKFGDKLTVIGVHSAKFQNEKDQENIRQAILRYDIMHPVINDANFRIWQNFAVRSWPTLILINPDGKIENTYSGEGNRANLESAIAGLIQKYAKTVNTAPLPIALEKNKQPADPLAVPSVFKYPGKIHYTADFGGRPALFIADSSNDRILVLDPNGTEISSIGGTRGDRDGNFAQAQFQGPQGLLYNPKSNILYVADTGNHKLRAVDFTQKTVTSVAGTGERGGYRIASNSKAAITALASPWDLAFYPDQNHIAIANAGSHQLWSFDIAQKTLDILAGNGRESIDDGALPSNSLSQPSGLSVLGDKLYFVDSETSSLRVLQDGTITTLIGTGLFDFGFADGVQGTALLQHALGLYADKDGVYIADSYNHAIRFYDFKTQKISTVAGNGKRGNAMGSWTATQFSEPNDIIKIGGRFLVADTNNNRLLWLNPTSKQTELLDVSIPKTASLSKPEELPNLFTAKPVQLTTGAVSIELQLQQGWKINHDAPSYLNLFQEDGKAVAQYDVQTIRIGAMQTPALADGAYRLQGTLYYCQDKAGAICLIRSFDQKIQVQKTAPDTAINLDLRTLDH